MSVCVCVFVFLCLCVCVPVCLCVCLCVCVWCGTIRPRLLIRLFWFLFILHSFARGRHVVGARRSNSFAEKPKTSVNVESARHSLCLCTYCKHNQSVFHCFGRRAMRRGESHHVFRAKMATDCGPHSFQRTHFSLF